MLRSSSRKVVEQLLVTIGAELDALSVDHPITGIVGESDEHHLVVVLASGRS